MPADAPNNPPSIWSRTFAVLFIVNLFQQVGQALTNTLVPLYAYSLGANAAVVGFSVGAFACTALLVRPFASPGFDSFSKKWFFFASLIVLTVASVLYGFATTVPAVIGVRLLHGVAMGCSGPLALALVTEVLPHDRMASGVSTFTLTSAFSMAVGPASGIALADIVGYRWTFIAAGIAIGISTLLVLTIKEPQGRTRPPYKLALSRCFAKEAVPPALLTCIFTSANASIMSFVVIYGGLRDVGQVGLFFTVNAIGLLVFRPFFGRLADRIGAARVIIPALVVYACVYLILSQATQLWMFLLAAIVSSCSYGVCTPLFQALAMSSVPRSRSGAASSTNFTGLDLSQLIGPAGAGAIAEHFRSTTGSEVMGYSRMYLVLMFVVLAGLAFFCCIRKRIDRNVAAATAQNEANRAAL